MVDGTTNFSDMKTIMKLILLSFAAVAFSSCNTMIGLGRDTRIIGESMEKSAEKSAGNTTEQDTGAPIY
jgi:predicted small secreted protein